MTTKELILHKLKEGPKSFNELNDYVISHGKRYSTINCLHVLTHLKLIISDNAKPLSNRTYTLGDQTIKATPPQSL